MEKEIWKPVVGFEGWYEVSSFGRLRSVDRVEVNANGVTRHLKGKMISTSSLSHGYPVAVLMRPGEKKMVRIHRLVAKAFIQNPENKPCIDHIDTNRANCRKDNLRWVDNKENSNNPISVENARIASTKEYGSGWKTINTKNKNGSYGAEVPVCQFSISGEFIQRYRSISEASASTNIPRNSIRRSIRGSYKQAGGFLWTKDGDSPNANFINTSTWKKSVFQYDKDGVFIKGWCSASDAERTLKIHNIHRCIKYGKSMAGGFWWSFSKKDNFFDT